jgi:ComF family protein
LISATQTQCGHCLKKPPLWDQLLAPWRYEAPLPQLIHRIKFNFAPQVAGFLGRLAAPTFQAYHELDPVDLIVPVPLHRFRLAKRCYNQAEWIARALAQELNCPLATRLLRRTRHTRAQAQLHSPAARRANTRTAFRLKRPHCARHIALVDDVITTGATVEACIRAWQSVSPARFSVWCLARAEGKRYP